MDIRGSAMTVEEVLESEEAYYLKRINGRNNTRILKMVADEMGLSVPSVVDTCAYDPYEVAICTTETIINDVHRQKDGMITALVKCVDSTRIENGILCCMHPAEGFWLFKVKKTSNFLKDFFRPASVGPQPVPPLSIYFLISYLFFFFSGAEKKKKKYEKREIYTKRGYRLGSG